MNRRFDFSELLIQMRNGLAFCFAWLVFCLMLFAWGNGIETISVATLFKLLALSFWAVFCFIICFSSSLMQKKGFIFKLTLFYLIFIPLEVLIFYLMGIFKGKGNGWQWLSFAIIIAAFYIVCLLIDWIVYRKQGEAYTAKLMAYNERRKNERISD